MENVGHGVVDRLYRTMMIDPEWSIRSDSGFTWWGHELAQRIWTSPMRESGDYWVSTVSAVTDLVTQIGDGSNSLAIANELNQAAGLWSYIVAEGGSHIVSSTSGVFHEGNQSTRRSGLVSDLR